MRTVALTLLTTIFSMAPVAIAQAPSDLPASFEKIISISIGAQTRHPGTPSWIGDYNKRWFHFRTTVDIPTGDTICDTATPRERLSLQRVGACPTVKTPTRVGW
jgi:hypothetical protein